MPTNEGDAGQDSSVADSGAESSADAATADRDAAVTDGTLGDGAQSATDAPGDGTPADTATGGDVRDAAEQYPADGADEPAPLPCPYSDWIAGGCAPVCGTANFGPGGPPATDPAACPYTGLVDVVPGLSADAVDDWPCGISYDGKVLHGRAIDSTHSELLLSIPSAVASNGYETFTLVGPTTSTPPLTNATTSTITFDGTTVVLASSANDSLLEAPIEGNHLGPIGVGHFGTLNGGLPSATLIVSLAISADGLTLYYSLQNAGDHSRAGSFVASRARTDLDFGPGVLLSGAGMQQFTVTGVSSDGLTAFLEGPGWMTYVISRATKADTWSAANLLDDSGVPGPGMLDYFTAMPTADCRYMITQCTICGAAWAQICELPRL